MENVLREEHGLKSKRAYHRGANDARMNLVQREYLRFKKSFPPEVIEELNPQMARLEKFTHSREEYFFAKMEEKSQELEKQGEKSDRIMDLAAKFGKEQANKMPVPVEAYNLAMRDLEQLNALAKFKTQFRDFEKFVRVNGNPQQYKQFLSLKQVQYLKDILSKEAAVFYKEISTVNKAFEEIRMEMSPLIANYELQKIKENQFLPEDFDLDFNFDFLFNFFD
ncbi:MAG: hypothetical protein A4E52_00606 [Pelotomaculum sp. PtaB.Bin013]|uniref:Uncharacterized protein n=1 Tax=Pelotomaculum isophthalicicum JI TaxID=947010 RepID=A0A9X4H3X7_9FIRM|nr:hypothetical protein [Pelotomaculum isophthalicicum]MDF9409951.1 hypothetical protein [Pelotomaculum isophthalicicum JI]OPX91121.1 MAG: hypothetical protein A4E52_00606 [Pelotomaculum sp. PtaB.Bin013]